MWRNLKRLWTEYCTNHILHYIHLVWKFEGFFHTTTVEKQSKTQRLYYIGRACVEGFQIRSDIPDNYRTQTTLLETRNVLLAVKSWTDSTAGNGSSYMYSVKTSCCKITRTHVLGGNISLRNKIPLVFTFWRFSTNDKTSDEFFYIY